MANFYHPTRHITPLIQKRIAGERYFMQTTLDDFYHQNYITPLLAVIINNTAIAAAAAPLSLAAKDYAQSECLREGIIELFAIYQKWGLECDAQSNFLHRS